MWSPFRGKAPPKCSSSTAVSALNVALSTSAAGVAPVALLRHSTVIDPQQQQHHHRERSTSEATSYSARSPSTGQAESTAPSSPKREDPRRASTVVVLLDGDHDYFKKSLLEQGHRGGKKAAIELHSRVEALIEQKEGEGAARPDVLCMLFWNKTGLSQHLASENGGRPYPLSEFAQGFSNSPFAAVAVDTGFSPQSADEALKAHLRIHVKAADWIILGGSHDGGYASALHQLDTTAYLRKIILLRTSGVCTPWLADLQLEEARFMDLFNGGAGLGDSKYRPGPITTRSRAQSAPLVPRRVESSPAPSPTMAPNSLGLVPAQIVPSHAPTVNTSVPTAKPSRTLIASQAPPHAVVTTYSSVAASTSNAPREKFKPLIDMLEKERDGGWRRSSKDHMWGTLRKTLRPLDYSEFGPYLKEAETLGLIDLHEAETGRVWVTLLLPNPKDGPVVRKPVAEPFVPLVTLLRKSRAAGRPQVLCGYLGERLGPLGVYEQAGVTKFGEYVKKAAELGLVRLGGPAGGAEWVALA